MANAPHHGGTLYARHQFKRAGASSNSCAPARPRHPRYPPQDRGQFHARGMLWPLLDLALRVVIKSSAARTEVYSLHAGGRVHRQRQGRAPYKFGCKVSIVTRSPHQGRAVRAARQGLARQPYDGHTLGPSSPTWKSSQVSRCTASTATRAIAAHLSDHFKVWISGQVRRVTKAIRREMRRRAAVEP